MQSPLLREGDSESLLHSSTSIRMPSSSSLRPLPAGVTLPELDDEVWATVLSYLSVQDVLHMSGMNRQLKNICSDELVWQRLLQHDFHGPLGAKPRQSLRKQLSSLSTRFLGSGPSDGTGQRAGEEAAAAADVHTALVGQRRPASVRYGGGANGGSVGPSAPKTLYKSLYLSHKRDQSAARERQRASAHVEVAKRRGECNSRGCLPAALQAVGASRDSSSGSKEGLQHS